MKRLLILLFVLLLTACSAAPADKTEPSAPSPAPEVTVPEDPEPVISYQVEILRLSDAQQAEDGTPLLKYAFHIPVLTALREDGTAILLDGSNAQELTDAEKQALAVTETFNEKFAEWTAEEDMSKMQEVVEGELAWYREEGLDWYGGYTWELTCSVYQTERMLSVSGLYYSYTGGAHPNSFQLSWNYDLEEGVFFEPELLADGTELRSAVAEEIIRQAQTPREDGSIPTEGYWEDYETLIADWSSYAVMFDETGMTVVFSPYELAPYVAGPQEFHVTYDWLQPHLSPHGRSLLGLDHEV